MDYDVINDVISQIIDIVNDTSKKNYDRKMMENLVVALLGYYLVLGPNIFKKLSKILDALVIYHCEDDMDYISKYNAINDCEENHRATYDPVTIFKDAYDDKNHFLGYRPYVVYTKTDDVSEVLILSHELSHVLDGENAVMIKNKDNTHDIDMAYNCTHFEEDEYVFKSSNRSFSEFAATAIENKVLEALTGLDFAKINYDFVKIIVCDIVSKGANISKGYSSRFIPFKDLVDNPKFFELMKKYYYEQCNEEEFKKNYESFGSDLSYDNLKYNIILMLDLYKEFNYFRCFDRIINEVNKFSNNTHYESKKEFLIMA